LSRAIPKKDYLIIKPSVTRLVTAPMPNIVLAINEATTQTVMREKLLDAQAKGGPDWEVAFVKNVLKVDL
jgi:hypothetical protein